MELLITQNGQNMSKKTKIEISGDNRRA